ncbi:OprO/OprP family phosphate-selective porin [Pseudomonas lopnurensis]|uniref:OprO/OprP family phosphate-selective porin n=1 Tax=Pseudomonas lopnurensis TaxID=1477517 RepID=UPI0028AF0709|nr:porin [Pseudomonas lopnurensis]
MSVPKSRFIVRKHFVASALALAVSAQAFAGTVTTDGADVVINTKGGLQVATVDKAFSFRVGGKLQFDAVSFDGLQAASQNQPFDETFNTFVRRGELSVEGNAYKDYGYGLRLAYDDSSVGDGTAVDRFFIIYSGLHFVDVTVGRYGVDYGLENTTSNSWITGIERPFMYEFLNGDEDTKFGVRVAHFGDNYGLTAQLGHYDTYESADSGNDEAFGYTLRANWAPYLNGTDVVHLGANFHSSNPDDDRARARTRLGIRSDNDDRLVFADSAIADKDTEWVLEVGTQLGAFRAQAEYFQRNIKSDTAAGESADSDLSGYYGQVSYMFGGVRKYKAAAGAWDKPSEAGAIEIFARYEKNTVDSDAGAIPGQLNDQVAGIVAADVNDEFDINAFVVGVNYFPTPALRLSLDYTDYEVDNINTNLMIGDAGVQDDGKAITGRLQFVF